MRLTLTYDGADLFIQGEWLSAYGVHSKRLTEDMPKEIRDAAVAVAGWANTQEDALRTGIEKHETAANLRREITRLEALERAARQPG